MFSLVSVHFVSNVILFWLLPDLIRSEWVLLGFTGFCWVFEGILGFFWVALYVASRGGWRLAGYRRLTRNVCK